MSMMKISVLINLTDFFMFSSPLPGPSPGSGLRPSICIHRLQASICFDQFWHSIHIYPFLVLQSKFVIITVST